MIATGIGAIVVLIGTLIANFDEIKNFFTGVIEPMEKFTQVLAGIGNSITNFVVKPFKAVFKLLKGDWNGAMEDFKSSVDFCIKLCRR